MAAQIEPSQVDGAKMSERAKRIVAVDAAAASACASTAQPFPAATGTAGNPECVFKQGIEANRNELSSAA